jgi:hypothetical protein
MTELLPIDEDIADGEDGSDEEIKVLDEDSVDDTETTDMPELELLLEVEDKDCDDG